MDFEKNIKEFRDQLPQGLVHVDFGKDDAKITIFFDTFLEQATNAMSLLWYRWKHKFSKGSEKEQVAQCMLQMMICKLRSIIKLKEGIDINIGEHKSHIDDPSSMAIILRSAYEMLSMFYYIYVKTDSETEREILFLLWEIRGMCNRQTLPYVPEEYKDQEEAERLGILRDIKRVKELGKELNMLNGAYRSLCKTAENFTTSTCGFEFVKDSKGQIVAFKRISFGSEQQSADIVGSEKYVSLYRMLSSYVHPSYMGILQFGQMFDSDSVKGHEQLIYMMSSIIACRFSGYFCSAIEGANEILSSLPEKQRNLLSMGNNMFPLK